MRVFRKDKTAESGEGELTASGGIFAVSDQQTYYIRGDDVAPHPMLSRVPGSSPPVHRLSFDNYVGLAEIGGARFEVQHSKLTPEAFDRMLAGVVEDAAALAFDFQAPTSLSAERTGTDRDVAYHAIAYLRHVMRRANGGEAMLGQFLQISRHLHRRREDEPVWLPPQAVSRVSPATIRAIAGHPDHLARIARSSDLAQTNLGRRIGQRSRQALFPSTVLTTRHTESLDTHENRLVKHLLALAADLVHSFNSETITSVELKRDLAAMRDELAFMRSHEFLSGVSPLTQVPMTSTVLQRRAGYREFLQHYLALGASTNLAGDRRWERLLDLKDSALLYEMWCFFETKRCLDSLLGPPLRVHVLKETATKVTLAEGTTRILYPGDVELVYNKTYRQPYGSYSVSLRPDIVIRRKQASGWRALILDAKLKFAGERLQPQSTEGNDAESPGEDREAWKRDPTKADLYKMHTYRDAIREAVGAFVLYPGTTRCIYPAREGAPIYEGMGALPLTPAVERDELTKLVSAFLSADAGT